MSGKALVVVDVQNDFVEGGSLAVQGGLFVADRIARYLMPEVGSTYACVALTKDWHIDPGEHWATDGAEPDFDVSWPVHCDAWGPGSDLVPVLSDAVDRLAWPEAGGWDHEMEASLSIFRKGQFAAAYSGVEGHNNYGENLVEWLRLFDVSSVDVVGLALDYCVKATALDLSAEGFSVRVLGNYTSPVHQQTMDSIVDLLGEFAAGGVEYV